MLLRVIVVVLVALAAPASASARSGVEIGMEDERLLLSEPGRAPAVVAAWRELGVDVVRLQAVWAKIAPSGAGGRAGFAVAIIGAGVIGGGGWIARSSSCARTACG